MTPTETPHLGPTSTQVSLSSLLCFSLLFLFCYSNTSSPHWIERYRSLSRWDANWYASITEHGYLYSGKLANPIPIKKTNIAFFPGLPLVASAIRWLTGLSSADAGLLASQLAFCIALFYLISLYSSAGLSAFLSLTLFFAYPGTFFNLSGLTESLLCLNLFGILYWLKRGGRNIWIPLFLHSLLLSLSHMRGLAILVVPLLSLTMDHRGLPRREFTRALFALCLGGLLGLVFFWGFLQWRFGHWDLYIQAQRVGWYQSSPNFLAPFYFSRYQFLPANQLNYAVPRMAATYLFLLSFFFVILDLYRCKKLRFSSLAPFTLMYLMLSLQDACRVSSTSHPLFSMLRYSIPVVGLLALKLEEFFREFLACSPSFKIKRGFLIFSVLSIAVGLFYLSARLITSYSQGAWLS